MPVTMRRAEPALQIPALRGAVPAGRVVTRVLKGELATKIVYLATSVVSQPGEGSRPLTQPAMVAKE